MPPSNVITHLDGRPEWDLAGEEIAYPIWVRHLEQLFLVRFHCSPYSAESLKRIMRQAARGIRGDDVEIDLVPDEDAAYLPLVDAHFLRMSGAEGSPEAQRAWLDSRPATKVRVAREGMLGGSFRPAPEPDPTSTVMPLGDVRHVVSFSQQLYSPAEDREVTIEIDLTLRPETEADYRAYRRASGRKIRLRQRELVADPDLDAKERLFAEMVEEARGFVLEGEPCQRHNRGEWVSRVPFHLRLAAIDRVFASVAGKNG